MATESPQLTPAGPSADSFIGSSVSMISKSEIRYKGVLFHINPLESTIGLKNVRTFGTEGQTKDVLEVLPSDRMYNCICFRGTNIKDLQVLPSVHVQSTLATSGDPATIQDLQVLSLIPVQSAPARLDDHAIIQSYYSHPATSSASLPQAPTGSIANLCSTSQLGLDPVLTSGSNCIEAPTPFIWMVDQLLQSAAVNPPTETSLPLLLAQKDVEVVQASTSEPLPLVSEEAKTSLTDRKLNTAPLDSENHDKGVEHKRRNKDLQDFSSVPVESVPMIAIDPAITQ